MNVTKFQSPDFLYKRVCKKKNHGRDLTVSRYSQRVLCLYKIAVMLCRPDGSVARYISLDQIASVIVGKDEHGTFQVLIKGRPPEGDFLVKMVNDEANSHFGKAACTRGEMEQFLEMLDESCQKYFCKDLYTEIKDTNVKGAANLMQSGGPATQMDPKIKMQQGYQRAKNAQNKKRREEEAAEAAAARSDPAARRASFSPPPQAQAPAPAQPTPQAPTFSLEDVIAVLDERMERRLAERLEDARAREEPGSPDSPFRGGLHDHAPTSLPRSESRDVSYSPPQHSLPNHAPPPHSERPPFADGSGYRHSPLASAWRPGVQDIYKEAVPRANEEDYWVRFVHRWEAVAAEAADAL